MLIKCPLYRLSLHSPMTKLNHAKTANEELDRMKFFSLA